MSVKWIKDTDTGELYPIKDDFEFEAPAHLETPEYNTVDYDKTRQMTIEQLQNQLIAAQNHIEAIENEKTSDNNSNVTVNDVSPEVAVESGFKAFWSEWYPIIILILGCVAIFSFGLVFFKDDLKEALQNTAEYQTTSDYDYEITPIPEIGSIPIYSSDEGVSLYLKEKDKEPQEQQEQQETEQE